MQNLSTMTVREIALEMPQTTRVFEEFKIDYCCGGRKPIAEACERAGVDTRDVIERLEALFATGVAADGWVGNASLPELISHILDKHHVFTKSELHSLEPLMDKVARVHGDNHPELIELKAKFEELSGDLFPHMMKEEEVLFPYIEQLVRAKEQGIPAPMPPFGTVRNPIRMMMAEHDTAGDILSKMRSLAKDFTTPPDACPSFTGLYYRLAELERDLHQHIHLENNVLFPRAVELEDAALAVAA